jgi:hypothetical protein
MISSATGPSFSCYVGIDYSGARTPTTGLTGLRVYLAGRKSLPLEISPPAGRSWYWTWRGFAEWLVAYLAEAEPTVVGIDHGVSFPLPYFEFHHLALDWPAS